jgi:outer membrane protein OmpA-like peptidoglycan-associated protein
LNRFIRSLFYLSILGMSALAGCAARTTGLTPAQIAVLQQEGFAPAADSSWQLGLSDKVLFASNSDVLNPDTSMRLEGLGKNLKSVEITKLRVEGHTDGYGTDAYNDQLSLHRAQAVADEFESAGFLETNIIVRGLGKRNPVANDNTPGGQAQNRRVSIIVPPDQ